MDNFEILVKSKYDENEAKFILKAYDFAKLSHAKYKRLSGEPYIVHPVAVATYLVDLGLDKETIAAALLHDVVEDTKVRFKNINEMFGAEVEMLVKGVSKISRLKYSKEITEMDSLKRLFIAMSKDVRVILIKLADRLHNIKTVDALPYERRIKFCTETMNLFVPLAERLGLNNIKTELEDKCFEVMNPEEYKKLKDELDRKFDKTTERMKSIETNLKRVLQNLGLQGEVTSRFKHFYSLFKKIKDKGTAKIYDIIAFRILVEKEEDCYRVLGEIHKLYKPVPGRIKDYIAAPKPNGYKSLHTTLITDNYTPFEVQIRTYEMHENCEYGIAAHWRYKNKDEKKDLLEEKLNWLKSIIEDEKQIKDSENFIKALRMDFSSSEIWVFTPKYKPISLPEGATPIDMAYAVHTELGNTCVGAKVNGRKVPLSYELETGDVVEILTSAQSKGPLREWLKIAVDSSTRSHIRNYFNKNIKPEYIVEGREILEKVAKEQNVNFGDCISKKTFDEIKKKFLVYSLDDMFASIALGSIKTNEILTIARFNNEGVEIEEQKTVSPVYIEGSDIEDVKFARCCNPIPGDEICAISSNNGITVHASDCKNIDGFDKEKLLSASWKDDVDKEFDTSIKIGGLDEKGVLSKIMDVFYELNIVSSSLSIKIIGNNKFEMVTMLRVKNKDELEKIINKLYEIKNIQFINRNNLT